MSVVPVDDEIRHPLYARFYARLAAAEEKTAVADHRRELVAGLSGTVLEVGVGPGLGFRHYPPAVTRLIAVEPEPTMREKAAEAAAGVPLEVEIVAGGADALPAADGSLDAVVVSQVLCSVPDQPSALAEARRVLRPGGELRFYEHVLSPEPAGRALQHALDATVWPHLMGGCRLTRRTGDAIAAAGFEIGVLHAFRIGLSPAAPHILGRAVAGRA